MTFSQSARRMIRRAATPSGATQADAEAPSVTRIERGVSKARQLREVSSRPFEEAPQTESDTTAVPGAAALQGAAWIAAFFAAVATVAALMAL